MLGTIPLRRLKVALFVSIQIGILLFFGDNTKAENVSVEFVGGEDVALGWLDDFCDVS